MSQKHSKLVKIHEIMSFCIGMINTYNVRIVYVCKRKHVHTYLILSNSSFMNQVNNIVPKEMKDRIAEYIKTSQDFCAHLKGGLEQ